MCWFAVPVLLALDARPRRTARSARAGHRRGGGGGSPTRSVPQSGGQISGDICQATDQHATHRDRHLDVINANVRAPSLRSNAPTRRRMDLREYPGRDGGSCRCVSTIEITAREARPGGGLRASRCAWWCAGHDRGHCQLWGAVLWLATRTRRPRIASMRTCVLRAYQRSSAARTCYAIAAAALGFTAVDTPKRI